MVKIKLGGIWGDSNIKCGAPLEKRKMNIIEATKKAAELNKCIYRESYPTIMFLPTNTLDCCLMYEMNENKKRTTFLEVRWNPKQSDLLADDWLVEE